jgi:hypothetical protein
MLLYVFFPSIFIGELTFRLMLIFGASMGAAFHRLIDRVLVKGVLLPFYQFVSFYLKFIQIEFQYKNGFLAEDDYLAIRKQMQFKYFLDADPAEITKRNTNRRKVVTKKRKEISSPKEKQVDPTKMLE